MARPDPLDQDSTLSRSRFGHAPALWLALPLLIGCAIDATWGVNALWMWIISIGTLTGAWLGARQTKLGGLCLIATGIALGAAWHQVKLPPQAAIRPHRNYEELSVSIERASARRDGRGWTGLGLIADRDGPYFRRRIALSVNGPTPAAGSELKISGHLAGLDEHPKGYDAWVASQGATLRLRGGHNLGVLEKPSAFSLWCQQEQGRLEYWLRQLPWTDIDGGALLAATMLGRTALLPDDAKAAFATTGTLHLFAISGLHIAGMAAALLWCARRLRLPEIPTGVAILLLLWLYVQITGASPSSVRAWMMAAFIWGGQTSERATPALQSLALACAVTLILSPEACSDPGFQLSYVAVLALITVGGPAAKICGGPTKIAAFTPRSAQTWRQRVGWKIRGFIFSGLCISSAATIAGTPLTLAYFGSASWGGILVNLFLVPLSEIPLVLGMASAACSPFDILLPLARWINGLAALGLEGMTLLAVYAAKIPGVNANYPIVHGWLGPVGALMLSGCFLLQAEATSIRRLLGIPALTLGGWLLLTLI